MKHIIGCAALLCIAAMTGCSLPSMDGSNGWNDKPNSSQTESKAAAKDGITDDSGEFVYTGMLQQIGDDENGYMQVPADFVPFQEEDVEGLTQYSNVTGTSIITLDFYEGVDYETAANGLYQYMKDDTTLEGLTGATVTVGGYPAYQLYCHYPEDNMFLVTWMIQDTVNPENSYYLAIEFQGDRSDIIACSSTFRTVTDYHQQEEAS